MPGSPEPYILRLWGSPLRMPSAVFVQAGAMEKIKTNRRAAEDIKYVMLLFWAYLVTTDGNGLMIHTLN